jgi:hypothetical protein
MAYTDKPAASAGGIVGFAAAFGISHFAGLTTWIPVICSGLVFAGLRKLKADSSDVVLLPISLMSGHALWMLIGVLVLPAMWASAAADLAISLLFFLWLIAKPSRIAFAILIVLELAGLAVNTVTLLQVGNLVGPASALLVHIVLRIAIIVTSVFAIRQLRKNPETHESTLQEVFE